MLPYRLFSPLLFLFSRMLSSVSSITTKALRCGQTRGSEEFCTCRLEMITLCFQLLYVMPLLSVCKFNRGINESSFERVISLVLGFFCSSPKHFFFLFLYMQCHFFLCTCVYECVFTFTPNHNDKPCSQSLISTLRDAYYALSRNSIKGSFLINEGCCCRCIIAFSINAFLFLSFSFF